MGRGRRGPQRVLALQHLEGPLFLTGEGEIVEGVPSPEKFPRVRFVCNLACLKAIRTLLVENQRRGILSLNDKRGIFSVRIEEGKRRLQFVNGESWGLMRRILSDAEQLQAELDELWEWCERLGVSWANSAAQWLHRVYLKWYAAKELGGEMTQLPPAFRPLAMSGYHGGPQVLARARCEPAAHWDMKRAYSHAMKEPLPVGKPVRSSTTKWSILSREYAMVDATVEIEGSLDLPSLPLPLRERAGHGCTVYPVGRFRGVWPSIELAAMERRGDGRVVRVHDAALWQQQPCLARLMEDLDGWEDAGFRWAKFAANAFHGKWAQRHGHQGYIGYTMDEVMDLHPKAIRVNWDDHGVLQVVDDPMWFGPKVPFFRPERAAFIAARARMRLFDGVRRLRPGSVAYIHVDAIWTDDQQAHPGAGFVKKGSFEFSRHFTYGNFFEHGELGRVVHSGLDGRYTAQELTRFMAENRQRVRFGYGAAAREWQGSPAEDDRAVSVPLDADRHKLAMYSGHNEFPTTDPWDSDLWTATGYPLAGTEFYVEQGWHDRAQLRAARSAG